MAQVLIANLALDRLAESPLNFRSFFDEKRLEELTNSIKLGGVKSPLLVRAVKDGKPWLDADADLLAADGYEIASGHRRFRAAKLAGLTEVPCVIQSMTDDAFIELLSVEIVQHEGVHPLDEAAAFRNLLKRPGYDADVIGARIGKEALYVQRRLSLLRLIPEAHRAFMDNTSINLAMAQILARMTPEGQKAALAKIFSKASWSQIKSSRQLQNWVTEEWMLSLKKAPFDPKDANLVPAAGACPDCPKRTGFMPELFPEIEDTDTCTDRECFNRKKSAAVLTQIAEYRGKHQEMPLLVSLKYEGQKPEPYAGHPVISRSRFVEASKKKKCEFQKPAIVVRGEEKVGKTIEVCTNQRCPVHHGGGGHREETPKEIAAREKREFEEKLDKETRRQLVHAIVDAFEADQDSVARLEDLRLLAKEAFGHVRDQDFRKGMIVMRRGAIKDLTDGLAPWFATAKPLELKSLALEAALSRHLDNYGFGDEEDPEDPDELMRAAKRWYVDVKAVRKQVETLLREQRKAADARAADQTKKREAPAAKIKKKTGVTVAPAAAEE